MDIYILTMLVSCTCVLACQKDQYLLYVDFRHKSAISSVWISFSLLYSLTVKRGMIPQTSDCMALSYPILSICQDKIKTKNDMPCSVNKFVTCQCTNICQALELPTMEIDLHIFLQTFNIYFSSISSNRIKCDEQ